MMEKINRTNGKKGMASVYGVAVILMMMAACDSVTDIDHTDSILAINSTAEISNSGTHEITSLSGGDGVAQVINDNGVIAGMIRNRDDGVWKAGLWTVDENGNETGQKKLGELPAPFEEYTYQWTNSINSSGIVVGKATGNNREVGFIYDSEINVLPWIVGETYNFTAEHINDNGVIGGYIEYAIRGADNEVIGRETRGAVWFPPYTVEPVLVSPMDGDEVSTVVHVTQNGVVTGNSYIKNEFGGFLSGSIVRWELDQYGVAGAPVQVEGSEGYQAISVNDAGDIAAISWSKSSPGVDLLRSGTVYELGGDASAISNPDADGLVHIAGRVFDSKNNQNAAYWTLSAAGEVTGPLDLGSKKYGSDSSSGGVNNHGWIVGRFTKVGQSPTLWYTADSGDGGDDPTPPPGDLTASFDYSCSNTATCQFTDKSTGENIVDRIWDPAGIADDGKHTFGAGEHIVTLTISDSNGNSSSVSETVNCSNHPRHGVRCS